MTAAMFLVSMWTMDLPKDAFRWTLLPQVWSSRTFSQGGGSPSSTGESGLTIIILSLLSRSDSEFEISPKSISRHSSVASNISA